MTHTDNDVDRNARLGELSTRRYQIEDQIKDLNLQLKETGRQHAERVQVMIDERTEKVRQLENVRVEAERLRLEKRI